MHENSLLPLLLLYCLLYLLLVFSRFYLLPLYSTYYYSTLDSTTYLSNRALPVLSVHIVVAHPIVSAALSRRTRLLSFSMRLTE